MPKTLSVLVLVLLTAAAALAHGGRRQADKGPFTLVKTSDNTYALFGRGGNVGIIVTGEGVVVIDDQYKDMAPGIIEEIKKITPVPVRFVINTHYHTDHMGGNEVFVKVATIVAHDNVRKRLLEQPQRYIERTSRELAEAEKRLPQLGSQPEEATKLKGQMEQWREGIARARAAKVEEIAPLHLTFSNEVRLHLGGEEIQVFHVKRGHTDGDAIIYLPKQKYLHMGDLYFNKVTPFIDGAGGADSAEWIETIDAVLARVAPDTKVVPGHGEVSGLDGLRAFRQYLVDLRAAVSQAVAAGATREAAVRDVRLPQYSGFGGANRFPINVGAVYDELKKK